MLVPVVAMSDEAPPVCGLVLQPVPFHTPRLSPTICEAFGDRLMIVTVTEPSVWIVQMCVNAPFCDSVPVKVSVNVCGVGVLAAASCDRVLSEHAVEASAVSTASDTGAI